MPKKLTRQDEKYFYIQTHIGVYKNLYRATEEFKSNERANLEIGKLKKYL